MTASKQLKALIAGLATVAAVGTAIAQGTPPTANKADPAVGAGQQSSQQTPMGTTGVQAQSGTATSGSSGTTGSSSTMGASGSTGSTSGASSSPSTASTPSTSGSTSGSSSTMGAGSTDTSASAGGTTGGRTARADRN